jgi:hypothetical protein
MEIQNLTRQLVRIEKDLHGLVSPQCESGFKPVFCKWVLEQWSEHGYYETEGRDSDFDVFSHPKEVNRMLKDTINTYAQFINSNTGNTEATHMSGSGIRCTKFDDALYEVYGDYCWGQIGSLSKEYGCELPEDTLFGAKNISDMISMEAVDFKKHPELSNVCESILLTFGYIGTGLEPYLVDQNYSDEVSDWQDTFFSDWTLADFRKVVKK